MRIAAPLISIFSSKHVGFKVDRCYQITDFKRIDLDRWCCFWLTGNGHQSLTGARAPGTIKICPFVPVGKHFSRVQELGFLKASRFVILVCGESETIFTSSKGVYAKLAWKMLLFIYFLCVYFWLKLANRIQSGLVFYCSAWDTNTHPNRPPVNRIKTYMVSSVSSFTVISSGSVAFHLSLQYDRDHGEPAELRGAVWQQIFSGGPWVPAVSEPVRWPPTCRRGLEESWRRKPQRQG